MSEKIIHEGRNVKRIREMFGIKQETLADTMGIQQKAISLMEQKEKLDENILADVAKALNVPVGAIKNMTEDAPANFINTFSDNSVNNAPIGNFYCTINPLEKYIEMVDKNEKLYERLLQTEREKVSLLEKILEKK